MVNFRVAALAATVDLAIANASRLAARRVDKGTECMVARVSSAVSEGRVWGGFEPSARGRAAVRVHAAP
jgi:hypothetical protein